MDAACAGPERPNNLASSVQAQDSFVAVRSGLRDLHQTRTQHDDVANGIAFGEDRLSAREALFESGRNDRLAIGWGNLRKDWELQN